MADEARITSYLHVIKDSLEYFSRPTYFTADVTGTKGPVPGALAISTSGTTIDLSELTTPALCRIQNLDSTNYLEYGTYNASVWAPLGEILAGETYVIRLSRNLGTLRLQANSSTLTAVVEAFET